MNPNLDRLQPYPFERLAELFATVEPALDRSPISLSVGEPGGAPPQRVVEALRSGLDGIAHYPATRGSSELRQVIAAWLQWRYRLSDVDADAQVLPVNGTREGLFAFAQAVIDRRSKPLVLMPNPFYQIYEGAALLAGADPYYLPIDADGAPEFDSIADEVWQNGQLLYICSPGNPTGAVLDTDCLRSLIERAIAHDFVIAADECYAEIYPDEACAPPGLLQACAAAGYPDFDRCVVFHSLSKRSNLPGLRSGFVAGDAEILERFARYRSYHGCAMPLSTQTASIAAWTDEEHVRANRIAYNEKFDRVLDILAGTLRVQRPAGGFYLWPEIPGDDEIFARELLRAENVRVLPGRYLGREAGGHNPGANRVRIALVPPLDQCVEAAIRIQRFAAHG